MKFFTKKSVIQKIMLIIVVLLLANFTIASNLSYAFSLGDVGSTLLKELLQLFAFLGDTVMGALNNFMLGAPGFGSAMLSKDDINLTDSETESWLNPNNKEGINSEIIDLDKENIKIDTSFITGVGEADYEIPNMLYSPENIFANNIAALDVNFLSPNEYTSIYGGGETEFSEKAEEKSNSAALDLGGTIASWYKSFRNIAVVGLLSVLIYMGIRILISSTAADKAKYKETLKDWLVALCLVFVIHFIMSAVLMITDKCNEIFGSTVNQGYIVKYQSKELFRTNLTGLVRFKAQSSDAWTAITYIIIYIALVIYTCIFTVIYFKRFLYTAFFTMIAPLVALTYPIDKIGDGKSQAFNMWFKEYTMNVIIQPVHLILYTVFVGSAYGLAANNPIYALVAIGFLIPAETFVKKMFGLNKADSTSGFGSFAGGALAMTGLQKLAKLGSNNKNEKNGKNENESDENIFLQDPNKRTLGAFKGKGNKSDESDTDESDGFNMGLTASNVDESDTFDDRGVPHPHEVAKFDDARPGETNLEYWTRFDKEHGINGFENNVTTDSGIILPDSYKQPQSDIGSKPQITDNNPQKNEKMRKIKGYAKPKGLFESVATVAEDRVTNGTKRLWANKKQIAKKAGRGLVRGFATATGMAAGLGIGLTTGDPSKVAQMMVAGGIATNTLAGTGMNLGGSAINSVKDFRDDVMVERYGREEAERKMREKRNKQIRQRMYTDKDENRKAKEIANNINYQGDFSELQKARIDMKEAGVNNESIIENALRVELEQDGQVGGKNHKDMIDIALFAQNSNITAKDFDDEKNLKTFDRTIERSLGSGDIGQARNVALRTSALFKADESYEKYGKYGKANMQKLPPQNKQPQNKQPQNKPLQNKPPQNKPTLK